MLRGTFASRCGGTTTKGRAGAVIMTLAVSAAIGLVASAPATASAAEPRVVPVAASEIALEGASPSVARAAQRMSSNRQMPREPRIVNGQPTTTGEWPWQMAIALNPAWWNGNSFQRQFCGGSLVAPKVVVTAAHCFFDNDAGAYSPPQTFGVPEYEVIGGRSTLSGAGGQTIDVEDYYVFVNNDGSYAYDPDTSEWDVVFLELAAPMTQQPIKLAGSDETAMWDPKSPVWATGWGTTSSGGQKSDVLREVLLSTLGDQVCGDPNSYGGDYMPSVMLCAGWALGGADACQGDSGGPLVAPMAGGGFRLVGVTSWGIGCALYGYPGIYARVADNPIRDALAAGIQSVFGVNVLGSGGQAVPPDTQAPVAKIIAGPKPRTKKRGATFKFKANEPAAFACRLDKKPWTLCSSPTKVKVKPGKHVFRVVAVDPPGNESAAAIRKWKVLR